ncbi:SCO1/SenC [Rhizoctonia solani]|uniref:SCO1/SenC n=1 Tax=Rhizoctonia solani TaxID=456999 RepID=A0A8H7M8N4_9AGAM|nr:SCO1/SenC [Rhizoctonia solani]
MDIREVTCTAYFWKLLTIVALSKDTKYGAPHELISSRNGCRNRATVGVFSWKAGALFIATGAGLYYYFTTEKAKLEERKRQEAADSKVGRPKVGGPFQLVSHEDKPFTHMDLLGKWSLIYFGFTRCPDICPEELDKMGEVVDAIGGLSLKDYGLMLILLPRCLAWSDRSAFFISCDPARDTVPIVKKYIAEFHPRLIGLTGTYEQVKAACKAYRVYFSTPPNASQNDDYLVDHSIFFYLMDPRGQFVDAFGKSQTADMVREKVDKAIREYP